MKHVCAVLAALAAGLLLTAPAPAGERADADVACEPAGEKLVYDCLIMLKGRKSGAPLEGAAVTVKLDMPSMPMAHNVRPVEAMAGSMPGQYRARLELQMHGIWTLTLDVSGPTRDRVVRKLQFTSTMAGPAGAGMKHGKMKMKAVE